MLFGNKDLLKDEFQIVTDQSDHDAPLSRDSGADYGFPLRTRFRALSQRKAGHVSLTSLSRGRNSGYRERSGEFCDVLPHVKQTIDRKMVRLWSDASGPEFRHTARC